MYKEYNKKKFEMYFSASIFPYVSFIRIAHAVASKYIKHINSKAQDDYNVKYRSQSNSKYITNFRTAQ